MLQPTPQKTVTTRKTQNHENATTTYSTNTHHRHKHTPSRTRHDTPPRTHNNNTTNPPGTPPTGTQQTTTKKGAHETHTRGAATTHPHPQQNKHTTNLKETPTQPTNQPKNSTSSTNPTNSIDSTQPNSINSILFRPTPCSVVVGLAAGGVAPLTGCLLFLFACSCRGQGLALFFDEGFHRHRTLAPVADAYRATRPPCPNLPASVDGQTVEFSCRQLGKLMPTQN